MTSGRLRDLLSHARQRGATRDATARQGELSHVAPPRECDTRHPDLSGVSPDFAARLSAEDLGDIAAGDIALGTVQAFEAAAVAREREDLKEFFEERAGILEFEAGLPRADVELEAARITATYARNKGHLWSSLRSALSDYPVLLAQVPDRTGPVDALPLGVAKVAVLKDKRVVRHGVFAGGQEVKG